MTRKTWQEREWEQEPLIYPEDVKIGDILTFRKGHEQDGIKNGDPLVVVKISDNLDFCCSLYVRTEKSIESGVYPDGFGYYIWNYEWLDKSKACGNCMYACKQGLDECPFFSLGTELIK
jgi:hypothetical protein